MAAHIWCVSLNYQPLLNRNIFLVTDRIAELHPYGLGVKLLYDFILEHFPFWASLTTERKVNFFELVLTATW
jgi:hypothetical protein